MESSTKKTLSYGLDFGTTNSTISVSLDGKINVLPINFKSKDPYMFQSAMYFKTGQIKFASEAIQDYLQDLSQANLAINKFATSDKQIEIFQGSTKVSVNQTIEYQECNIGRIMRSFKSLLGNNVNYITKIGHKSMSYEDILAVFFREIKKRADNIVGQNVEKVVIGRPVKFVKDDSSGINPILHLTNAMKLAGFKEIEFQYEPVGAAFGYGSETKEKIFVFDFGGGTLDTSIVNLANNKILSSYGAPIGGDLMDQSLYDYYIAKFLGKNLRYGQRQLSFSPLAVSQMISWFDVIEYRTRKFFDYLDSVRYRANEPETIEFIRFFLKSNLAFPLRKSIVEAKEQLSNKDQFNFVFETSIKTIKETFEKSTFEKSIESYLEEATRVIKNTFKIAGINLTDIDKVIMTGGSSLIPKFRFFIEEMFGKDKVILYEPFTAVSKGLAVISKNIFK